MLYINLNNQLNFIVRFLSIYAMCQKRSNSFQKMLKIFKNFSFYNTFCIKTCGVHDSRSQQLDERGWSCLRSGSGRRFRSPRSGSRRTWLEGSYCPWGASSYPHETMQPSTTIPETPTTFKMMPSRSWLYLSILSEDTHWLTFKNSLFKHVV